MTSHDESHLVVDVHCRDDCSEEHEHGGANGDDGVFGRFGIERFAEVDNGELFAGSINKQLVGLRCECETMF